MKKLMCVICMITAGTAAVFGTEFAFSAGAGGLVGGLFTRYSLSGDNGSTLLDATEELNQFNYGGFLFVDGTWAEASLSLQGGQNTYRNTANDETAENGSGSEMMLGIGLLGKYPIALSRDFTLFPLAGIQYQIALLQSYGKDGEEQHDRTEGTNHSLSMWNAFFINIGAGMDYHFSPSLFLRTELVYNFRLMTRYEEVRLKAMKREFSDLQFSGLTSGPMLKLAAGWRFS